MAMKHSSKADDTSALYEVAMTGNTSTPQKLIQTDINSSKADDISALYEAAMTGNTSTLLKLIQSDTLILRRSTVLSSFSETPLHISVLAGHVDFTREILQLQHQDPDATMAMEVDFSNSTPLHLAAVAPGHTEIVRILLSSVGTTDACLVRNEDGRIPLHLAVIRGRVGIVRELFLARPESVLEELDGDTVLHLCVKHNHLETLKLLVEMIVGEESLSASIIWLGNRDGNTVLHLAVMLKLVQTTSYLASLPNIGGDSALNLLNGHGLTPLYCLELYPKDYKSQQIRNLLVEAGGGDGRAQDHRTPSFNLVTLPSEDGRAQDHRTPSIHLVTLPCEENAPIPPRTRESIYRRLKRYTGHDTDWEEGDLKETVLIVATIIASMSFQCITNPPGGVWSENRTSSLEGVGCSSTNVCKAGTAVLSYGDYSNDMGLFLTCNTFAFGASLGIISSILIGVPMKYNACVITQGLCFAITFMVIAFATARKLVAPLHTFMFIEVVSFAIPAFWFLGIMVVLLLDTIRFVISVLRKI